MFNNNQNRNRRRRPRYRARPTRRPLNQIGNRTIQPLGGISHSDETVQVRKMTYSTSFDPAKDTNGGVAFNQQRWSFEPNTDLVNELKALAQVYEQYSVARVEAFATPGKGFDANNKFKLKLYSRVDPDDSTGTVLKSYFSILSAQNTVLHTFNERGRVKFVDFRPKFFGYGDTQATTPFLPSHLQWYSLDPSHYIDQEWRGFSLATAMPDETISPGSLSLTIDVSITFKFRGRVIATTAYPDTVLSMTRDLSDYTISPDVKGLKTNVMPAANRLNSQTDESHETDSIENGPESSSKITEAKFALDPVANV